MSDKQLMPHSEQAAHVYDRVLERVEKAIADAEVRTWETIKREIDEAIEFEYDVAELTRDELDLLGAYIRRDLRDLYAYLAETGEGVKEWLKTDLTLIEDRVLNTLMSLADPTTLEQLELGQKLEHEAGQYMAGEVACAGVLHCLNCHYMMCLVETTTIEPCHKCGSHYFKRITSRWPRDEDAP